METMERWLAWFLYRAALQGVTIEEYQKHKDVIVGLMHYANGNALSRDYRAIRGC